MEQTGNIYKVVLTVQNRIHIYQIKEVMDLFALQ